MKQKAEPVCILVIDPTPDKTVWNHPSLKKLRDKAEDQIELLEVKADVVIGPNTYRVFPHTMDYVIAFIKTVKKDKLKFLQGDAPAPSKKNANKEKA